MPETVLILVFANIYYLKIARDQAAAAGAQAKESQRQAAQKLTTTIAILRGILSACLSGCGSLRKTGRQLRPPCDSCQMTGRSSCITPAAVPPEFRVKALAV